MIRLINSVLKIFGIQFKRTASLSLERQYYEGIIKGSNELYKIRQEVDIIVFNDKIACLAFSKDRPLQLHALLSSYFKFVTNPAPIDIIYKASTIEIESFYQELASEFSSFPVRLIKEQNFYTQVIHWLETVNADRIFFLTDDAVFLEEMNLLDCLGFHPINEIFSFKNGRDFDYSFAFDKFQELPSIDEVINSEGMIFYRWRWDEKKDSPGWNYPLSVDGNVFYRREILSMLNNVSFKSPNSLESSIQVFIDLFTHRNGVSYSKVKMVNVPCNLVQNEFANRTTGFFTSEELLIFWKEHKRIDIDNFYQLKANEAICKKYTFYLIAKS